MHCCWAGRAASLGICTSSDQLALGSGRAGPAASGSGVHTFQVVPQPGEPYLYPPPLRLLYDAVSNVLC